MESDLGCETVQVEPQAQSINCRVVSKDKTYAFTLSALYDNSSESPQSDPFIFTLPLIGDITGDGTIDLKEIIAGLQVLMNLAPGGLVKAVDVIGDAKMGLGEYSIA